MLGRVHDRVNAPPVGCLLLRGGLGIILRLLGAMSHSNAAWSGRVGVVCHVNPDCVTSVKVYWHCNELTCITDVWAPDALQLVSPDEVPEYDVALKMSLEL